MKKNRVFKRGEVLKRICISIIYISIIVLFVFFPGSLSAEQLIAPGNVLNITVPGYPELSKSVVVRQDGMTDYPMLANIPIDGMTTSELKELLLTLLTRYV